ncbi:MAG: class I SAM-dependent methyltransferase [Betaproteobacteria bacterium]|nr:class I SAM-dependent methyltransferase [Betaproteobacteria bacterium]
MIGATPNEPRDGKVLTVERGLLQQLLHKLNDPPLRIVLWDGTEIVSSNRAPIATLFVRTRSAFYRMLWDPNLHFGDDYASGEIDVEGDIVQFIATLYEATSDIPMGAAGLKIFPGERRPRRNTLKGSREHIHHHYDIGNAFYRLWLDAEMQYTCAYFETPDASLDAAQLAKLDHVCRKLRLGPKDTVVEAGCGWGGLALHMARHFGVARVRSYNISEEQVRFARERAQREGLADRVDYVLDDYRNIDGCYDVFVSVGMLEHVGVDNYRELGEVIHRSLAPDGRGLIHSIGRNRPGYMHPWIERRIFPGAYPPALSEMMQIFEARRLSVLDVENLRPHYAMTLHHWLERFEAAREQVRSMYDERFVRMWRLYLAGSKAAFIDGELQLFQVLFTRPKVNDWPLTRGWMYR